MQFTVKVHPNENYSEDDVDRWLRIMLGEKCRSTARVKGQLYVFWSSSLDSLLKFEKLCVIFKAPVEILVRSHGKGLRPIWPEKPTPLTIVS